MKNGGHVRIIPLLGDYTRTGVAYALARDDSQVRANRPKLGIRGKLRRRIKRAEALQASPIRIRSLPISSGCSRRLDAAQVGRALVNERRDVDRQIFWR